MTIFVKKTAAGNYHVTVQEYPGYESVASTLDAALGSLVRALSALDRSPVKLHTP
jgi:predicted RNase H-like HicB family nuclease